MEAASGLRQQRADKDLEEAVELVHSFVISSVQFLNRFVADCEARLLRTSRSLQQLEVQTQLLEHLLISATADEECGDDNDDDGSSGAAALGAVVNRGGDGSSRGLLPLPSSVAGRGAPPLLPANDATRGRRTLPAPPGGQKDGPPLPPNFQNNTKEEAARAAMLQTVGASVLLPPMNDASPPPPPPLGLRHGRTMRCHPRLHGYYELLNLRVPADLIRAKMTADGFDAGWLDTPDAAAPSGLTTAVRCFTDEPE